jgi:uncharacterized protein (DUF1810 family)
MPARSTKPSATEPPGSCLHRSTYVLYRALVVQGRCSVADSFDPDRFVQAQANSYDAALAEIMRGNKRSHWMWYIFPQLDGLGRSETARFYAIRSIDDARAYLAHPVLGRRLIACVAALQDLTGTTAEAVFGGVDAMKLRSSLTLFSEAGGDPMFAAALDRWFAGKRDDATLRLLDAAAIS